MGILMYMKHNSSAGMHYNAELWRIFNWFLSW